MMITTRIAVASLAYFADGGGSPQISNLFCFGSTYDLLNFNRDSGVRTLIKAEPGLRRLSRIFSEAVDPHWQAQRSSPYPRAHARSSEAHLKLRKLKRSAKIRQRQRQRHSRRSPGDPRRRYIKLDPSLKKVSTREGACGACSIMLSAAREKVPESSSIMQCEAPASEPQRSLLPSEVMIVDI